MQLVVNAGSSSLKWALFSALDADQAVLEGVFERLGGDCVFRYGRHESSVDVADHGEAVAFLLRLLQEHSITSADEVGSCVPHAL